MFELHPTISWYSQKILFVCCGSVMISPKWMEPDYTHIMWTLHVWIPYPHKYWALYALIYALWVLLTVKMRLKVLWKNHLYHLGIYVFRYKWEAAGLCTINCSSWVVLKQETIEIYIWELCMWYLYIYIYMCVCVCVCVTYIYLH